MGRRKSDGKLKGGGWGELERRQVKYRGALRRALRIADERQTREGSWEEHGAGSTPGFREF